MVKFTCGGSTGDTSALSSLVVSIKSVDQAWGCFVVFLHRAASTVWPGPRAMCSADKLRLPKRDETNERIGNLRGDGRREGADR